ncbi:UDP-N-acetylglucosamine 1-carboxyvinyltransferase 2 isoform X1 [Rosa chinensis]|uniref:UDP-N-acetylglucosamine 1-carboxyvinyltransferase 2 isoform X1 n=1 Tax=Rosa chinensis TaxID=74649 RepID=UPI000D0929EF|nr:UDP-N-acetylglucosamine 1-carboxyvinyltransferase 2 isoform X1 [Rosa chinensis]XP_024169297.1 UDP-N-acetylglucosamine 1-carboxyvinyltransferase 2 isoform X1 [Rosa chinensis]
MAACMADGTTILSNVAREPEVVDLARFLTKNGACVEGAGSNKLVIKGKSYLHGCKCTIAPDRIEAGTFMLAAAITRSFISISPVIPSQVSGLMQKLLAAGCKIRQCSHDTLEVSAVSQCGENLRGFEVKTGPFPGFPTDLQLQTMALLTTWFKSCRSLFEKRMAHEAWSKNSSLCKLCSGFRKDNRNGLSGSCLAATDLRGGISLVLAALAAEGTTEISGVAHIVVMRM